MLMELHHQRKSRSLGLNRIHSRLLDRNSNGSPEPLNNSVLAEENSNINNSFFSIAESTNIPPLLSRSNSKRLGYKSKASKKRPLIMKTELPSLAPLQTKQVPYFMISTKAQEMSPGLPRQSQTKSGRIIAGYYMGNSDSKNKMKIRYNSPNPRTFPVNTTCNLALTRLGYLPALKDILEETPKAGANKQSFDMPIKQQKHLADSSFRTFTETSIHNEAARRVEGGHKSLLIKSKKPNRIRTEGSMGYGNEEKRLRADHVWEYLRDYQEEKSSKESKRRLNNESFQSNMESILTGSDNENSSLSRYNSFKLDPTAPKEEKEQFHKNNFIKMVYRRTGKNSAASQNDKQFEESWDNRRVAFMKKLGSLQGLKYN